ncbi:MAG TPA: carboxylating nicotinate-nucleotide diphosphorylase [Pyrinomonadaceae bacterium]|nr:carboxylating nicotinate-nucleotide diphosphorylase [Pyrinomonadaceae bacterium]
MNPEPTSASSLTESISECIKRALAEDIGSGDVTTNSIVTAGALIQGQIVAKQKGTIAGLDIAREVFRVLDTGIRLTTELEEGSEVDNGRLLASVSGPARGLLTGERTALNFLGRMSGIATLTRQFVQAVAGTRARILDTRKTAPGLRLIDKLAVRRGGGENHRIGLFDMVLIKDNHIDHAGSITEAVNLVRTSGSVLEVEVEARTLADVGEALDLNVERILLDNMSIQDLRRAVILVAGRARLEASGNVTIENVREIAETGVDYISVGALTHSARVFDVSLQWSA